MADTMEELEAEYVELGEQVANLTEMMRRVMARGIVADHDLERLVDDARLAIILNGDDTYQQENELWERSMDASHQYLDPVLLLRELLSQIEGTDPSDLDPDVPDLEETD